MGEIAEMILEGTLCQTCGVYMGDFGSGHPESCMACRMADERDRKKRDKK